MSQELKDKERLLALIELITPKRSIELLEKALEEDVIKLEDQAARIRQHLKNGTITEIRAKYVEYPVSRNASSHGGTFRQNIKSLLNDGIPKTANELLALYNDNFNKNMSKASFSPQISTMVTKFKDLKIHVVSGNPIDRKNYYGLIEWFNNEVDGLSKVYINKIENNEVPRLFKFFGGGEIK